MRPVRFLSARGRSAVAAVVLGASVLASVQCGKRLFRQYEYEEEIYLYLDGSATVIVNASIPALVALRGLDHDTNPRAAVDRAKIRRFYESDVTQVTRVSRPWRRANRRFVHVRVETRDIRALARAAPFAWSVYRLVERGGSYTYTQRLGAAAGKPVDAGWDGSEIVAVRMHVPSRVEFHNAPSREVERGNILAWEQPLRDRLAGRPVNLHVRMETGSILARTLTIFGLSLAAALALMASIVWWVVRKGRSVQGPSGTRAGV
jgi:hypothetical protein